jgi:hypothetical protein
MSSFNKYINGTDPHVVNESYCYQQGFDPNCDAIVDPTTNEPTTFQHAGDPVASTGWLDSDASDRRFMMSTGPFTFEPWEDSNGNNLPDIGETGVQEVIAAIVVGQGGDRISSVSVLKYNDKFAQEAFDVAFNVPPPPPAPSVTAVEGDGEIVLYWDERSEVDLGTDFQFEGYNIYQLPTIGSSDVKKIATYDVNNGVGLIIQDGVDTGTGAVVDQVVQAGSDAGVKRSINITQDFVRGTKLYNGSTYYFAVTAYSYNPDPAATVRSLESALDLITVQPNQPKAGDEIPSAYADVYDVTHTSGKSDGRVAPIVVDPRVVTGGTYQVTFKYDEEGNTLWDLEKSGETILADQAEVSTLDTNLQPFVDGLQIKVAGPAPGVNDWDAPEGTRRFTWAGGAGSFGWESFSGAIGWGSPCWVFGPCAEEVVPASELKKVLLILATVGSEDADGNYDVDFDPQFDPNDPNVSYGYRFGRGFTAEPAEPEFAEHIVNSESCGGYCLQDFEKTVPLSAWDMEDPDNPRRLAVAFLENNQPRTYAEDGTTVITPGGGLVDGKWWPGKHGTFDNSAGGGPREWLFILDEDYSETPNPEYTDIINVPIPSMYWLTVGRRGSPPFSPNASGEDQFLIIPAYVNTPNDVFEFTTEAPTFDNVAMGKEALKDVKVVPNPYFAKSAYELDQFNRVLKFTNLPATCTIRVFNLAGDLVNTIEKDDDEPYYDWNLTNSVGIPISSGIYIWYLESDFGDTYGKMAIFTEEERLDTY